MIDVARLRKGLEFAHAHPEEHDQSSWAEKYAVDTTCGTTMCLAGTVVFQAGYNFNWPDFTDGELAKRGGIVATGSAVDPKTGEVVEIEDKARELLGLDPLQAGELFYTADTIQELYRFANRFTDGEIEIPDSLR
jgi:hypothetical protein